MNINWPELVIGGVIFFVIGAVFSIFFQPGIERRLGHRRDRARRRREDRDAALAAEVKVMAESPTLFAATFRGGIARAIVYLMTGFAAVLGSFALREVGVFGYLEFLTSIASTLLLAIALLCTLPVASTMNALARLSGGVSEALRETGDPGTGARSAAGE